MLSRRSFFIGLAATAAIVKIPPTFASAEIANEPSRLWIAHGFDTARVGDLMFSSCPNPGEGKFDDQVTYTISRLAKREEQPLFVMGMNPRATYRWVSAPGHEIVVRKAFPVRLDVEPCHSNTTITIGYDVRKNFEDPPIILNETFRTKNGRVVFHKIHALDPKNEYLVE